MDNNRLARQRWRWPLSPQVVVFGIVALAVLIFLRLANEMAEGETRVFDSRILLALRDPADLGHSIGPSWLQLAVLDLTAIGGTVVLTLVALAVIGFFAVRGRWWRAAFLAAAIGGGALLNTVLKIGYARPRPTIVVHLVDVTSQSFPSGHAMNSAIVYLTLGAIASRGVHERAGKIYVMAMAVVLTLIVGCTRVFLGVHWPTDVLAGWAAGAAWATLCWLAAERLQTRYGKPL